MNPLWFKNGNFVGNTERIFKKFSVVLAEICHAINSEAFSARIIGVVLGNNGDQYYYCMLNKDENIPSEVRQNKAMLGIESIGSVSGRGFELMNSFVECIKRNQ